MKPLIGITHDEEEPWMLLSYLRTVWLILTAPKPLRDLTREELDEIEGRDQ